MVEEHKNTEKPKQESEEEQKSEKPKKRRTAWKPKLNPVIMRQNIRAWKL
jgi:hypothetical protein